MLCRSKYFADFAGFDALQGICLFEFLRFGLLAVAGILVTEFTITFRKANLTSTLLNFNKNNF